MSDHRAIYPSHLLARLRILFSRAGALAVAGWAVLLVGGYA